MYAKETAIQTRTVVLGCDASFETRINRFQDVLWVEAVTGLDATTATDQTADTSRTVTARTAIIHTAITHTAIIHTAITHTDIIHTDITHTAITHTDIIHTDTTDIAASRILADRDVVPEMGEFAMSARATATAIPTAVLGCNATFEIHTKQFLDVLARHWLVVISAIIQHLLR